MAAANLAQGPGGSGAPAAANARDIVFNLAKELNTDKVELPGFPEVVARIHRALADEKSSANQIVGLVRSEPALAVRIVHLANSAAFNRSGKEVSDPLVAINKLGFNILRSQVTSFAMRQMERQEWLAPIRPVLTSIWKASNGVAAICHGVARRSGEAPADEALSAGLFHLIGRLYLIARARQQSIDPREIADWEGTVHEWHATIARTILDHWKIPAAVGEAAENQNGIFEGSTGDLAPLTRILCGAKLYHRLRAPGAQQEPEAEEALARIWLKDKPFEEWAKAALADIEVVRQSLAA